MVALSALHGLRLFRDVGEDALGALAAVAQVRNFASGEPLFHQDDAAALFYVLIDGRVKITRGTAGGKEQTLYIVEPGEPFCFCTIFGMIRQPANAYAMKSSSILALDAEAVERSARNNPAFLLNILDILNGRLMNSMQMIEDLALRGIPQRLASFLLQLFQLGGSKADGTIRLDVPKHEIAKILGTTPETLSRILTKLSAEDLISVQGRTISINDFDALRALADS